MEAVETGLDGSDGLISDFWARRAILHIHTHSVTVFSSFPTLPTTLFRRRT